MADRDKSRKKRRKKSLFSNPENDVLFSGVGPVKSDRPRERPEPVVMPSVFTAAPLMESSLADVESAEVVDEALSEPAPADARPVVAAVPAPPTRPVVAPEPVRAPPFVESPFDAELSQDSQEEAVPPEDSLDEPLPPLAAPNQDDGNWSIFGDDGPTTTDEMDGDEDSAHAERPADTWPPRNLDDSFGASPDELSPPPQVQLGVPERTADTHIDPEPPRSPPYSFASEARYQEAGSAPRFTDAPPPAAQHPYDSVEDDEDDESADEPSWASAPAEISIGGDETTRPVAAVISIPRATSAPRSFAEHEADVSSETVRDFERHTEDSVFNISRNSPIDEEEQVDDGEDIDDPLSEPPDVREFRNFKSSTRRPEHREDAEVFTSSENLRPHRPLRTRSNKAWWEDRGNDTDDDPSVPTDVWQTPGRPDLRQHQRTARQRRIGLLAVLLVVALIGFAFLWSQNGSVIKGYFQDTPVASIDGQAPAQPRVEPTTEPAVPTTPAPTAVVEPVVPEVKPEPTPPPAPVVEVKPPPEVKPDARYERPVVTPEGDVGFLVVSSKLSATIYVDGKKVGKTPISRLALSPGNHRIKAVAPGRSPRYQNVRIDIGQASVVSLNF